MTRSSTNFPKVASTTILINVGNKLTIAVLKTEFKDKKCKNKLSYPFPRCVCVYFCIT